MKRTVIFLSWLALHIRAAGDYVVFSLKNKKGGLYAVLRIESSAGMTYYVNAPYMPRVRRTTLVGDQSCLLADPKVWHELRIDVHGTEFYGYVDGRHVVDYDFRGESPPWYPQKRHVVGGPHTGSNGIDQHRLAG